MLKKWFLSLLGLAFIPALSFALDVTLTDSISRVTTEFPIKSSLSKNGKQIYLVYEIAVNPPSSILAAEIFNNKNGRLQTIATLDGDETFFSVDSGFANPDFDRFTLVDDDEIEAIRIRLFDENFNQLAVTIFNDYAPGDPNNASLSGAGGVFSPDGKYVVISYLIDATPGSQITIIRVLNANDLSLVASTTINGGSSGPNFFSHGGQNYVTLTSYGGDYIFEFENPAAAPPSTLFVFKLHSNELRLIDQTLLPQQAGIPNFFNHKGKTMIGIGTVRAVLPGEPTIFVSDVNNQSFLPKDNRELRIYSFNGRKLKLVLARQTGLTTASPVFSPKGLILVNEQVTDGFPGFFNLFQLKEAMTFNFIDGAFASPPFAEGTFSANSKWLVIAGSDQQNDLLNNINLYRIKLQNRCH